MTFSFGADFGRRPLGDLDAEIDDDDAVGNLHHRRHVVLDQEQRDAAVAHRAHHLDGAVGLVGVHAGERLVEQQHLRVGGEADGDAERAQMALRQVARDLVPDRPEAEKLEDLVARAAELRLVAPRRRRSEIEAEEARVRAQVMGDDDAVARRHALEDRRLLKGAHDPLARHDMRREAGNHLALERHLAAGRLHERGDQLEDRRLARAVRADDRQDLVRLDVERDLVDRGEAAVALGEVLDLEDRRHRLSSRAATAGAG